MPTWLLFALLSLFGFGVSGFFSRLAVDNIDSKSVMIISTLGNIIIIFILACGMNFRVEMNGKGVLFSVLGGTLAACGVLCFLLALSKGGAITSVSPISGIYPLVTITLAVLLLGEPVTVTKGFGILFALAAVILLSI